MPVDIKQLVSVKVSDTENQLLDPAVTPLKYVHSVKVVCDNPDCKRGPWNADEKKEKGVNVIEWNDIDPDSIPRDAWQILTVEDFKGNKKVFCCHGCLKHVLFTYQPLKPPTDNVVEFPSRKATPVYEGDLG